MQSMLGDNCRMPLLHLSERYIWFEETNKHINELSIGYMMNPTLYKNRFLKDQVKVCFKHVFGPDTISKINKILVIFYESVETIIRKLFRVFSCVIYTIIDKYVCIDYLGSE